MNRPGSWPIAWFFFWHQLGVVELSFLAEAAGIFFEQHMGQK
jgi:hypothetical protein